MKKTVSLVSVAIALALVFSGCSSSGGSDSTDGTTVVTQSVAEVVSYRPSDLSASGATVTWQEADIAEATGTIMDDPMVSSAMSSFASMYDQSSSERASSMTLEAVIDDVATTIANLPVTKSVDKTYDLSGKPLSAYFNATTLKSTVTTTIATTDGAALDTDYGSNFLSGIGHVTLDADIDAVKAAIPATSSIKDMKMRVKFAAAASLGSFVNEYGERETKDLSFSYATSMSFAASYNDGSVGGKIVVTASANKPVTTIDTSIDSDDDEETMFIPSTMSLSVTAYNDAGTVVATKNFTTFGAFLDYINNN